MKTKYDVGDIVLVPMKVDRIEITNNEDHIAYSLSQTCKTVNRLYLEKNIVRKINAKETVRVFGDTERA